MKLLRRNFHLIEDFQFGFLLFSTVERRKCSNKYGLKTIILFAIINKKILCRCAHLQNHPLMNECICYWDSIESFHKLHFRDIGLRFWSWLCIFEIDCNAHCANCIVFLIFLIRMIVCESESVCHGLEENRRLNELNLNLRKEARKKCIQTTTPT